MDRKRFLIKFKRIKNIFKLIKLITNLDKIKNKKNEFKIKDIY